MYYNNHYYTFDSFTGLLLKDYEPLFYFIDLSIDNVKKAVNAYYNL